MSLKQDMCSTVQKLTLSERLLKVAEENSHPLTSLDKGAQSRIVQSCCNVEIVERVCSEHPRFSLANYCRREGWSLQLPEEQKFLLHRYFGKSDRTLVRQFIETFDFQCRDYLRSLWLCDAEVTAHAVSKLERCAEDLRSSFQLVDRLGITCSLSEQSNVDLSFLNTKALAFYSELLDKIAASIQLRTKPILKHARVYHFAILAELLDDYGIRPVSTDQDGNPFYFLATQMLSRAGKDDQPTIRRYVLEAIREFKSTKTYMQSPERKLFDHWILEGLNAQLYGTLEEWAAANPFPEHRFPRLDRA